MATVADLLGPDQTAAGKTVADLLGTDPSAAQRQQQSVNDLLGPPPRPEGGQSVTDLLGPQPEQEEPAQPDENNYRGRGALGRITDEFKRSTAGKLLSATGTALEGVLDQDPLLKNRNTKGIPDSVKEPAEDVAARIIQSYSKGAMVAPGLPVPLPLAPVARWIKQSYDKKPGDGGRNFLPLPEHPGDIFPAAPKGGVAEGMARAGGDFAQSMATPENAALMLASSGAAGISPLLSHIISGGFGVQMAKGALDQIPEVVGVFKNPKSTLADKIAAVGSVLFGLTGAAAAAAHAMSPLDVPPDIAKTIEGKHPVDAIDMLDKAAKTDEDAAKARDSYIEWWQNALKTQREGEAMVPGAEEGKMTGPQADQEKQRAALEQKIEQSQKPSLEQPGLPQGTVPASFPNDQEKVEKMQAGESTAPTPPAESTTPAGPTSPAATSERPTTGPAAPRKTAPAVYAGTMSFGADGEKPVYRLNEDILGGTKGQTVTAQQLERAGYEVPPTPAQETPASAQKPAFKPTSPPAVPKGAEEPVPAAAATETPRPTPAMIREAEAKLKASDPDRLDYMKEQLRAHELTRQEYQDQLLEIVKPKEGEAEPEAKQSPHDAAQEEVDNALIDPEVKKSKIISLARKALKNGLITDRGLAEVQRMAKDKDMGPEDLGNELKMSLRANAENAQKAPAPVPSPAAVPAPAAPASEAPQAPAPAEAAPAPVPEKAAPKAEPPTIPVSIDEEEAPGIEKPAPTAEQYQKALGEVDERSAAENVTSWQMAQLARKYGQDGLISNDNLADILKISENKKSVADDVAAQIRVALRSGMKEAAGEFKPEGTPAKPIPVEVEGAPEEKAPAHVETTPDGGVEAKTTEVGEKSVSRLVDKKQFGAQKAFINDALGQLIDKAPDEPAGKVVIHVPDDGSYSVVNSKAALTNFRDIINKRFGKSFTLPFDPRESGRVTVQPPFGKELGGREAPNPKGVARLNDNPTAESITKTVALSQSTDSTRYVLNQVAQDGPFTVATDGRRLTFAIGGKGRDIADIAKNKDGGKYPNWREVVPKEVMDVGKNGVTIKRDTGPYKPYKVDAEDLIKQIDRAAAMLDEKHNAVGIYDIGNGKLAIGVQNLETGEYSAPGIAKGSKPIFSINSDFLRDGLEQARGMGTNNPRLYIGPEDKAMVLTDGDRMASVIMPVRMDENAGGFGDVMDAAESAAQKERLKRESELEKLPPDKAADPNTAGFIDARILKYSPMLLAGASGASYGWYHTDSDDPEVKLRNALGYGAAAAMLTGGGIFALSHPGGTANAFRYLRYAITKDGIPHIRAADENAANGAFRLVGARQLGYMQGASEAIKNLGTHWDDPDFDRLIGSVTVHEMQLAKLDQLYQQRDAARATIDDPKADAETKKMAREDLKRVEAQIPRVKPVFDMPGTAIHTQEEFDAALKNPEVQAVLEKHKAGIQQIAEERQRLLGGKIAALGPNTGVFVNTEALLRDMDAEKGGFPNTGETAGMRRGNLLNPRRQGSSTNMERAGTAEGYDLSYKNQVAKMASANAERAAKVEYYNRLQDAGLATTEPDPEDMGNWKREETHPYLARGEPLYIRKDIWSEHRHLMQTDSPLDSNGWLMFAKAMNTVQLKSITDPTFHVANIEATIARSLGRNSPWDIASRIPGVNIADANIRLMKRLRDVCANDPELLGKLNRLPGFKQLSSMQDPITMGEVADKLTHMAETGALRATHPGIIQAIDRAGRLVMDDLYDNLVDQGLAKDSEASRRDFINQIGQYDTRLMGRVKQFAKEAGVAPFIVAGQNFNRGAVRALVGAPGVEAASGSAMAKMMASNLAGTLVSTIAVPLTLNYLLSGKIMGPPGTPVGAIGWTDKEGTLHYVDPLKWTNLRRGMRITGLNSVVNGLKDGYDPNHIAGESMTDIIGGMTQPWCGPAVNAASVMISGHTVNGYRVADIANPLDRTNFPTGAQFGENAKAALGTIQPQIAAYMQGSARVRPGQSPTASGAANIAKSLGKAVGYSESSSPVDEFKGASSSALWNQQQARDAEGKKIQTLASRWNSDMTADEATETLSKMTEPQIKRLLKDVTGEVEGLTGSDRNIRNMTEENGDRARFLLTLINRAPDKAEEIVAHGIKVKTITDSVANQIQGFQMAEEVAAMPHAKREEYIQNLIREKKLSDDVAAPMLEELKRRGEI